MDPLARHFWDGCAAGELRFRRCTACGTQQGFPRDFCPACGATAVEWRVSAGRGTVHAATLVTRAPTEAFRALVPYAIVLVDLDEGVRMMAHGAPGLAIGQPVMATFVAHEGRHLPRFVPMSLLRPPAAADHAALLRLNNAHAVELSWLSAERLPELLAAAFHARMAADRAAFLIAFDQDADYDSPNFLWFRERYRRFVYVDRVVVAPAARGRGLARALYADLFAAAAEAGHDRVCCEVNSAPPNPASDAFHAALGFAEVGGAHLADRDKSVRYLVRELGRG